MAYIESPRFMFSIYFPRKNETLWLIAEVPLKLAQLKFRVGYSTIIIRTQQIDINLPNHGTHFNDQSLDLFVVA